MKAQHIIKQRSMDRVEPNPRDTSSKTSLETKAEKNGGRGDRKLIR